MSIYPKPSIGLVYDLINQSNPGLSTPVSASNVKLGTPTAITPEGIRNTSIRVQALPNQFYIGNTTLKYRRINLPDLFKNMNLEIRKYSAAASNVSPYSLYNLLNDINTKFGLSLTTDDFTDANFPAASDGYYTDRTSKVTLVTKSTSLAYIGSVDVRWVYDKPLLDNIIGTPDIPGRLYPGGNTFDSNHLHVLDSEVYGLDLSDVSSYLEGIGFNSDRGIGGAQISQQQPVFDYINNALGTNFTINSAGQGNAYNIYGGTNQRYTLPDATLPQANSQYYNRCVVITIPGTNTWGVGRLFLHYNV